MRVAKSAGRSRARRRRPCFVSSAAATRARVLHTRLGRSFRRTRVFGRDTRRSDFDPGKHPESLHRSAHKRRRRTGRALRGSWSRRARRPRLGLAWRARRGSRRRRQETPNRELRRESGEAIARSGRRSVETRPSMMWCKVGQCGKRASNQPIVAAGSRYESSRIDPTDFTPLPCRPLPCPRPHPDPAPAPPCPRSSTATWRGSLCRSL